MQKSEYSAFIIPTSSFMKRLVVLISGNGSNLQAIIDACNSGLLNAQVVSVISNKADAYGLIRAKTAGIEAVHFAKLTSESRQEYDSRLAAYVSTCLSSYAIRTAKYNAAYMNGFMNRSTTK